MWPLPGRPLLASVTRSQRLPPQPICPCCNLAPVDTQCDGFEPRLCQRMSELQSQVCQLSTIHSLAREKVDLKLNIQKTKIMASSPITSWQIDGETIETVRDFILGGSKITADGDCSHEIKTLAPLKKSYDQPRQHIKKQKHCFVNKGPSNQSYGFSSSHVWM